MRERKKLIRRHFGAHSNVNESTTTTTVAAVQLRSVCFSYEILMKCRRTNRVVLFLIDVAMVSVT